MATLLSTLSPALLLVPALFAWAGTAISAPASATPIPVTTDASELEDRLLELGLYYGDGNGQIPISTTPGDTLYIATSGIVSPFAFYTTDDPVDNESAIAACAQGLAGEPVDCDAGYGETMLFALEEVQAGGGDPSEFHIECDGDIGTGACMISWNSGRTTCYLCDNGRCEVTSC